MEFGYDPDELLDMMHLRTDKKSEMLKSVKSKFLTGDKAQGI